MARVETIVGCWRVIETAGIPKPWSTESEIEEAARVWAAVLADVPDGRLQAMTIAWLRSSEARFGKWPMPGSLLGALPDEETVDDADEAWADALGLIRILGWARCPATVEALEDRRTRLRAAYREATARKDPLRAEIYARHGKALPREDAARNAAIFAGVAACGGWRALGLAEEEAIPAHRASFRAAYRSHRSRRQLTETEAQVVALLDTGNRPALPERSR